MLALLTGLLLPVPTALAGVGFGVVPDFPTTVTVGQTGLPATYTITNVSDGSQAVGSVTINQMTMVPSCSNFAPGCAGGTADPGTFDLSATGVGAAGTACAGTVFNIVVINASTGEVEFQPIGGPVILAAPSLANDLDRCQINFTFDVLKMPNHDSVADPGVQTNQIGFAIGRHQDGTVGTGSGSDITTVLQAQPTIATTAIPPTALGGTSTDSATLTGPGAPAVAPTGTITFNLFGPNNDTCTGTPHSTSVVPVDHFGPPPYVSAASNPIVTPGTYHWVATYSGDANYLPAGPTACLDPAETFTVGMGNPTITTVATPPTALGGTSTDQATLAAPPGVTVPPSPAPTGQILFQLFGPDNPTCDPAGPIHSTSTVPVDHFGAPPYTSAPSNPIVTPGTYHWVATYQDLGDPNYNGAGPTACTDPAETFVVAQPQPTIATTATGPSGLGGTASDSATLTAPAGITVPPAPAPTGTITFNLFGPNNETCTGTPHSTSTVPVDHFGPPPYASGPSNPIVAPGTYHYQATYSGDANYAAAGPTACLDPAEDFTVGQSNPTIATTATPPSALGGTSTDAATLTAPAGVTVPPAPAPTGTITFNLFGPNNDTCTGTPHSTSTVPVDHFGPPPYTSGASNPITAAGTYHWQATYSGDANYAGAGPTACTDPAETFVVAAVPISIQVVKDVTPATRPEPGGDFTFSVVVTNTSTIPLTITSLVDNVYGDLFDPANPNISNNTCGALEGVVLQPNQSTAPCTFVGEFTGDAGDSQTDIVTVVGTDAQGRTATDNDDAVVTLTPAGPISIQVVKNVTPATRVEPGGDFTFSVVVTNTSNIPLTITSLIDNVYGDLGDPANPNITNNNCDDLIGDTLQPGESTAPCTFVGEFIGDAGDSQTDIVTVVGTDAQGRTVTDNDDAVVTLTPTGPLSIQVVKNVTPATRVEPGGPFTFSVVVTNTSGIPLTITSLVDNVYGDLFDPANPNITNNTCGALEGVVLNPGQSTAPCTFVGQFTGDAGDTQTDIVTVVGTDAATGRTATDDDDAVVTLTPAGPLSIQVVKDVTPAVRPEPGGPFSFSVVVTNTSNIPLTITSLIDNVYGDLGDPNNPNITNNNCDDLIGDVLQPGQSSAPCTFIGQFTGDAGDSQTDIVTVVGTDAQGRTVIDDDDAVVTLTPAGPLTIRVVKSASPESLPVPGGDFTFTVVVTNTSNIPLTITSLIDNVYGDLGDPNNPNITDNNCDDLIGDTLQPGQSSSPCTFVGEFTGDAAGSQTDIVTVVGRDAQGRTATDDDDAVVTLFGLPAIQVDKTVTPASREVPGGDFTFTVVVTNTGPVPVNIVSLNDDVYGNLNNMPAPSGGTPCSSIIGDTLAPGQSVTCQFVGSFTGDEGDSQTDVVTVVGVDSRGNQVTDEDDAVVTLFGPTSQPAIRVEKDASPPSLPQPGGDFVFTVRVSNVGPDSLTIESLTDDVHGNLNDRPAPSGGTACSSIIGDTLDPGESATCQFIGRFTGNSGASQTDVVTVIGRDDEGRTVTDTDDAVVRITGVDSPVIRVFFIPSVQPPNPPSAVIVNNNNSSSSSSSSSASAAAPAPPVIVTAPPAVPPAPVTPPRVTPPRTVPRTGFDSLGLAGLAALLIVLGFMMLHRSAAVATAAASPGQTRRPGNHARAGYGMNGRRRSRRRRRTSGRRRQRR